MRRKFVQVLLSLALINALAAHAPAAETEPQPQIQTAPPVSAASQRAKQPKAIEGMRCDVCEAYRAHVRHTDCGIGIDPNDPELRGVEWHSKELMASKELLKKVEYFRAYGTQFAKHGAYDDPQELELWIKQMLKFDHGRLWVTEVDIDNDGTKDQVLKYEAGRCPRTRFWGTAIVVLAADGTSLDEAKSKPLMQGFQNVQYEIFTYKKGTYFVARGVEAGLPEELHLLRIKNNQLERISESFR